MASLAWWFTPAQCAGYAASCIGTTALFFLQGLRMRGLMLAGTLLWLLNNLLVGSACGSLLEACLAASNLWTIRRLWLAEPVSPHAARPGRPSLPQE